MLLLLLGQQNKPTSQQPEAEYEEIPGEAQGAIEMKENTAYGPVTPRGGPVYEVPGGGGGAVTTNRGIQVGENVAYGPVIPRDPEYEEPNEGIETGVVGHSLITIQCTCIICYNCGCHFATFSQRKVATLSSFFT